MPSEAMKKTMNLPCSPAVIARLFSFVLVPRTQLADFPPFDFASDLL